MSCEDAYVFEYPGTPLVIDSINQLLHVAEPMLQRASVVGIDAEWPPHTTRGPRHRGATLVQLACLTHSPHHDDTVKPTYDVLLLDLMALLPTYHQELAALFRDLFRSSTILKVGFSFSSDILAISNALGAHIGPSTVSKIRAIIDIKALHRRLLRINGRSGSNSNSTTKESCHSLSSIVSEQFNNASLDKREQCSEWGRRPLTDAQIKYAATDAYCLVKLLETYALSSLLHHEWVRNTICSWGESWYVVHGGNGSTAAIDRQDGLSHLSLPEMSANKNKKKKNDGSTQKNSMDEYYFSEMNIPWMNSQYYLLASPKFLVDVMLAGLARQLRLWGFDAESMAEAEAGTEAKAGAKNGPKMQRHAMHRVLVERSEKEGRVVLTRDTVFMTRKLSSQAYFVRSSTKKQQLEEVIRVFRLSPYVCREMLLSRCAKCNGDLGAAPVPTAELKRSFPLETHGVPEGVMERVNEFWVCTRCHEAYWQGNMYDRAMEQLGTALERMTVGGEATKAEEGGLIGAAVDK